MSPAVAVVVLAYTAFAVLAVVLSVIDLRTHRLPDRLVLPALAVLVVLFWVACLFGAPWSALQRALLAGVALFVAYLLVRLVSPASLGGGDVKLAALVGCVTGWLSWSAVLVAAAAAFLGAGMFALVLVAARRGRGGSHIAFGPWMLGGAWAAILLPIA